MKGKDVLQLDIDNVAKLSKTVLKVIRMSVFWKTTNVDLVRLGETETVF